MTRVRHLLVSLFVFASLPAPAAPPPVITGVRPKSLVTFSTHTSFGITIYGQHFWPSGANIPSRWEFYVRRQYLPFQRALIGGVADTFLECWFDSLPLLNSPGTLEIMVKVDGVASNVFPVRITSDAPTLAWVQPNSIRIQGTDDTRWKVWLAGDNWLTTTTIWVDGVQAGGVFNYDKQQFTWPANLRKVGTYKVQIRNEHGGSEIRTVQVLAPTPSYSDRTTMIKVLPPTPTPAFATLKAHSRSAAALAAAGAVVTPTPTPKKP